MMIKKSQIFEIILEKLLNHPIHKYFLISFLRIEQSHLKIIRNIKYLNLILL